MTDYGWYLRFALFGVLVGVLAELPPLVQARFPWAYRGPIAALGAARARRPYPLRQWIPGLITALGAVFLLRSFWPDWFDTHGWSPLAAAVVLLVVAMSFEAWRPDSLLQRLLRQGPRSMRMFHRRGV